MSITAANRASFGTEVIEKSKQVPVIVDFWASWCAPCQAIAPMLEQLAAEFGDRLAVVKVNADEEGELLQANGVRGLPTLKVFRDGAAVREAVGLQPYETLRQLVEPYLPDDPDSPAARARALVDAGEREAAEPLLREALEANPEDYQLHPVLAGILVDSDRAEAARELLDSLPVNEQETDAIKQLYARINLLETARDLPDPQAAEAALNSDPAAAHYQLGVHAASTGDFEQALDHLLESVRANRTYADEAARRMMIDLFRLLDNNTALVREFQTELARTLN